MGVGRLASADRAFERLYKRHVEDVYRYSLAVLANDADAEDVVDPPVTVTAEGTILVPKTPGIGYNVVEKRLSRYCVRREFVLS